MLVFCLSFIYRGDIIMTTNNKANENIIESDEQHFTNEELQRAKEKAVQILENSNPMEYLIETVQKLHIGDNKVIEGIILAIANQSCSNTSGLQIALSGVSGDGKTHVCKSALKLLRKDYFIDTSLSARAVFYKDIEPGTIIFSDDVTVSDALEDVIKRSTTNYQESTKHTTVINSAAETREVPPRIVWLLTSVDNEFSIQVLNRQLTFDVDSTDEQKRRIFRMQKLKDEKGVNPFNVVDFEVIVCREIFEILKSQLLSVKIPFAGEIEFRDVSNTRNYSFFSDMIKGYAIINQKQRKITEEGVIEATRDDFAAAKILFDSQANNIYTRLNEKERKILQVIANNDECSYNTIATKLSYSYYTVQKVLVGRKDRNQVGLLDKVPALTCEDTTLSYYSKEDGTGQSKKMKIFNLPSNFNLEQWENMDSIYLKSEVRGDN